jgi:hypothetical protein
MNPIDPQFPSGTEPELSHDQILQARETALGQFDFVRNYTLQLLDSVPRDQWTTQPPGAPSHLAWQVGHLAVSQYGLMLFRQRGRAEGDMDLMPGWLRKRFGRGSSPPSPQESPTAEELLEALHRIDRVARSEIQRFSAPHFRETIDMPYAVYPNKLGALLFCPIHESIHAGQIGLLRRMLGHSPIR